MERPPRVQLVQSVSLADGHAKDSEIHTDSGGRFAAKASGSGDRHYELENNRRNAKQLAEQIALILREHHPDAWSFAAPAEINQPVLDHLDAGLRKQVVENLPRDLVKLSPNDLLGHFQAVRAA